MTLVPDLQRQTITPRTRKATLLSPIDAGTPTSSLSPRPSPASGQRRRRPRGSVSYIPSQAPRSSSLPLPSPGEFEMSATRSASLQEPLGTSEVEVDELVRACEGPAAWAERTGESSAALNNKVLHAVASKERRCLELRDELANEERMLQELRSAWGRLAARSGAMPPQRAREPPQPAAHADDAQNPWRQLSVRLPGLSDQFHHLFENLSTREGHARARGAAPADAHSGGRPTAVAAAVVLGRTGGEPGRGRLPSPQNESLHAFQKQLDTYPPLPPRKTGSPDANVAHSSERLAASWGVLSRRLRDTASSLGAAAPPGSAPNSAEAEAESPELSPPIPPPKDVRLPGTGTQEGAPAPGGALALDAATEHSA